MRKFDVKSWIIFVLLSAPFIDISNGVTKFLFKYNGVSPGQVIRIVFFAISLMLLMKIDLKSFKWASILQVFMGVSILINIINGSLSTFGDIFREVLFDIKFLYVIVLLMLLKSAVKLKKITLAELEDKAVLSIFIAALSIIITTALNIHEGAYGTIGSKGLFTEVNAVTVSLLIGLGLQFNAYIKNYKSVSEFFKLVTIFVAVFMIGTKSSIVFAMVIIISAFLRILFKTRNKRIIIGEIGVAVIIITAICVYFVYGSGSEVIDRLRYFYEKMNIWSFLVSGRDEILYTAFTKWSVSICYILFGTGYAVGHKALSNIYPGHGSIEMDFFDTYYFFGSIVGTIILVMFSILVFRGIFGFFKKVNRSCRGYIETYVVAFVCTMLGGHVLYSPLAGLYFAVIYILVEEQLRFSKVKKDKKLRIIHAGPDLKEQGGVVTVMKNILDLDFNEEFEVKVLPTFTSSRKILTFMKSLLKYIGMCCFKKPDIIHLHMASKGSFYRKSILILISDLFDVKVIIHLHGACFREFYASLGKPLRKYCRYIFNKSDEVIVLTNSWVGFAKVLLKDESKIKVVSNFVKLPEKIERNTENYKVKILFLGRLGKRKGAYLLIKAAEIMKKNNVKFKLILAGDGEIKTCKRKIAAKNLEKEVEVTGWIGSEEKDKYLKECDILALPSYFESFGMSLIEGMSYSIPVIAANAGAMPEVVDNNKDGIIIETGDYNALADALTYLIENKNVRIDMGRSGYTHAERDFSDKTALEKLRKIYRKLGI